MGDKKQTNPLQCAVQKKYLLMLPCMRHLGPRKRVLFRRQHYPLIPLVATRVLRGTGGYEPYPSWQQNNTGKHYHLSN